MSKVKKQTPPTPLDIAVKKAFAPVKLKKKKPDKKSNNNRDAAKP